MIDLEDNKHLLYAVRIIFEKKEIDNLWESHQWVVNDLIPLNVLVENVIHQLMTLGFVP